MESQDSRSIFANRLKNARKMAGLSLQQLSDRLRNQVSKQALNKYEQGLMNPVPDVLIALSKALEVSTDYFLKKDTHQFTEISFRKRASLLKKEEEAVVEKARHYLERYIEIESILAVENSFKNPLKSDKICSFEDVDAAAIKLRESWNLGSNPISNVVEMLEIQGIKIFLVDTSDELDGFATYTDKGIPLVMINVKDKSIERKRFTIIHELAHILLQLSPEILADQKSTEAHCHYFASCFLLPTEQLFKRIGGKKRSYIQIKELIAIKIYYGISIRAIVHRLRKLEVISETYYTKWMVWMSKTYGQKDEPGSYPGIENSTIMEELVNRAFAEGIISIGKAAALCGISVNEFRKGSVNV